MNFWAEIIVVNIFIHFSCEHTINDIYSCIMASIVFCGIWRECRVKYRMLSIAQWLIIDKSKIVYIDSEHHSANIVYFLFTASEDKGIIVIIAELIDEKR